MTNPTPTPTAQAIGPEWQPCVKLPITVHVREQRPGESHVSTREGITPVRPDDLIMRGVQGEECPIGRELFDRTYRMGEATPPAAAELAMDCAEEIADAMEEDADDPDFPEIDEITRDDLISAAETIRRYAYFKKTQEDDSND